MTMLSPTDILQEVPELKKHFTDRQIGYLRYVGLVRGRKIQGGQRYLLCLEDVLKVLEFKKTNKA
jgi:hypothetical protein